MSAARGPAGFRCRRGAPPTPVAGRLADRGSASLLLLGLSMLVALVAAASTVRGVAVVARHRAEAAADLAALAAAQTVFDEPGNACAEAESIAQANGAHVSRCSVAGDIVEVDVVAVLWLGRLGRWTVFGRARAGPAPAAPPAT